MKEKREIWNQTFGSWYIFYLLLTFELDEQYHCLYFNNSHQLIGLLR